MDTPSPQSQNSEAGDIAVGRSGLWPSPLAKYSLSETLCLPFQARPVTISWSILGDRASGPARRAGLAQIGAEEEGAARCRGRMPKAARIPDPRGSLGRPGAGPSVPLPQSSRSSSSGKVGRRSALVPMAGQMSRAGSSCDAQSSCGARCSCVPAGGARGTEPRPGRGPQEARPRRCLPLGCALRPLWDEPPSPQQCPPSGRTPPELLSLRCPIPMTNPQDASYPQDVPPFTDLSSQIILPAALPSLYG